ncbi:MAG TPA: hypothetical protein VG457_12920, partial [Planctomycetota bacterium]|nr:hypothetical protein [Planctomycetota bacterium]
ELVVQAELLDLEPQEVRTYDFRNDFLSQMIDLVPRAKQMLRRELVKNQLYQISLMDDALVEIDDVIQTSSGERFYVNTVVKDLSRNKKATVTLTCWKVFDPETNAIEVLQNPPSLVVPPQEAFGYGFNYGQNYGEGL